MAFAPHGMTLALPQRLETWREMTGGGDKDYLEWLNDLFAWRIGSSSSTGRGRIVPLFVRHGTNEVWTNKYELVVDIDGVICGRGGLGRRPCAELGAAGFLDKDKDKDNESGDPLSTDAEARDMTSMPGTSALSQL